jgi:hypothetical protein
MKTDQVFGVKAQIYFPVSIANLKFIEILPMSINNYIRFYLKTKFLVYSLLDKCVRINFIHIHYKISKYKMFFALNLCLSIKAVQPLSLLLMSWAHYNELFS